MAWAASDNTGLLDRWQKRVGQAIWHFHQVLDTNARYTFPVWTQGEREELAATLNDTFYTARKHLGFYPKPTYFVEEIRLDKRRGYWAQDVRLIGSTYLQGFGVRATESIEADVTVTYSDSDSDGINDLATITVTTDEVTDGEIALFFRVADGATAAADSRYRIYADNISYSGGDYTITTHRARLAKPLAQMIDFISDDPEQRNQLSIANDSTDFVTAVDVYRVYRDTTTMAKLVVRESTASIATTEVDITPVITNAEASTMRLSTDDVSFSGQVESVKIYAYAGYPLDPNGEMFAPLETMLIRQAKANLPIDAKYVAVKGNDRWEKDDYPADPERYSLEQLNTPFGVRNVDVYAWQTIQTYRRKQLRAWSI